MIQPGTLPIGGGRWVPLPYEITVRGIDLTAATLRAQVRLRPNAIGAPLIDLAQVTTASAEGVRFVGVDTVGGLPVSTVTLRVNETTMEGMPDTGDPDNPDAVFAWDLHVTPAGGGLKYVLLRGSFTVQGGVTQ